MTNFPSLDYENMGGNSSFEYSPSQNIDVIPDHENQVIDSDLTFYDDYDFYTGVAQLKSLQFTEVPKPSGSGMLYEKKITGFYPKQSADVLDLFQEMARHTHVVKIKDNNGNYRLVGDLNSPLKFKFSQDTGDAPNKKNGYRFEFYTTSKNPSPYIE